MIVLAHSFSHQALPSCSSFRALSNILANYATGARDGYRLIYEPQFAEVENIDKMIIIYKYSTLKVQWAEVQASTFSRTTSLLPTPLVGFGVSLALPQRGKLERSPGASVPSSPSPTLSAKLTWLQKHPHRRKSAQSMTCDDHRPLEEPSEAHLGTLRLPTRSAWWPLGLCRGRKNPRL